MTPGAVRSTALIPVPRATGDDVPVPGTTPPFRDVGTCRGRHDLAS